MKKKIIGILVCMLMFTSVLSTTASAFNIEFKGGIGATVVYSHTGNSTVYDMNWSTSVYGGVLERINVTDSGFIDEFNPNDKLIVRMLVFGFGKTTLFAFYRFYGGLPTLTWTNAFVLGPFVIILGVE